MFGRIFGWLQGVAGWVWEQAKPLLKQEAGEAIAALMPYAREAVLAVAKEYAGMSSEEKREAAIERLQNKAGKQARDSARNILNTAIEWAYSELKDECEKIEDEHKQ